MDRLNSQATPSIYAAKAYEIILSGMNEFRTEEDQRRLLDSLLSQCVVFVRLLNGKQAFQDLLERLNEFEREGEFEELSDRVH